MHPILCDLTSEYIIAVTVPNWLMYIQPCKKLQPQHMLLRHKRGPVPVLLGATRKVAIKTCSP